MAKARDSLVATIAILAVFSAEAPGVHLRGRIIHVGFPGKGPALSGQGDDSYRVGCWTPIVVELANDDGDLFHGRIEARQADRDGDEIVARQDVSVRGTRRHYLYIPGGVYKSPSQFNVRVFGKDGRLAVLYDEGNQCVAELSPPRPANPISNETRVILDISEWPVNQLLSLVEDPLLVRGLLRARGSPRELPDNVAGLDMVDVIVWDGADPGEIDLPQREALSEWTRRGGTLVLGVSKNWLVVSKSKFGEVLPARLTGVAKVASSASLPGELTGLLFGDPHAVTDFSPPLTYCPVRLETLASDASPVVPAAPEPQDPLLVTRRPCGRGQVVLVAAEMRELFKHATRNGPFLRQVLGIRRHPLGSEGAGVYGEDLFRYVQKATAFKVIAELYFLFAFAFAIAYIAVATAGSWTWLKRKGMMQHAWAVFALIAVLASGVSLAAVRLIRGIGNRVEEFTVVDGRAGLLDAAAISYFGLKSASHTLLDLSVPTDWLDPETSASMPGALAPLAPKPDAFEANVYAAGQRYEAVPVVGELRSVPLRATLKQFEAVWCGRMNGRVDAWLQHARRDSSELHPASWIENDLGTALDNCYLFVANRSFMEDRPSRCNEIHVYPIGELADGQRLLVKSVLARQDKQKKESDRASIEDILDGPKDSGEPRPLVLRETQESWLKKFRRVHYGGLDDEDEIKIDAGTFASALLLLSTFGELDPGQFEDGSPAVVRSQGQRLDRWSYLTRDTALFVGFSRDPGPARLCWRKPGAAGTRWRPIHPSRACVMYRIAIPIAPPS